MGCFLKLVAEVTSNSPLPRIVTEDKLEFLRVKGRPLEVLAVATMTTLDMEFQKIKQAKLT